MSVSSPFIARPIATSLLAAALLVMGVLGFWKLPVSSLPQVDFPTIEVTTRLPGADPATTGAVVTAPLERQFGQIASMSVMTSESSYGLSRITLQFGLDRDIDAAAQDVQAAINAAAATLPTDLPYPPVYSKVNPADTPILTLALTSDTAPLRQLSDLADTLISQRLSEISGVGRVSVAGGVRPALVAAGNYVRTSRSRKTGEVTRKLTSDQAKANAGIGDVLFWLVRSVTHKPMADALPDGETLGDAAREAALDALDALLAEKGDAA